MSDFFQDPPRLGNQYAEDRLFRAYLAWRLPSDVLAEIEPGLERLGARVAGDLLDLAERAEAAPPRHVPYDPWGRRTDRIEVSDAWRELHRAAAEEGIVATGYERRHGPWSRVHQFARLYLFHPSSAVASCPMAMTDGAARLLELYGDEALRGRILPRLTTRDPDRFWTSGQWMTERTGGSDVSETSTVARREGNGYRLYGTKWFTSATTSEVAATLARTEGAPEGNRGLSLFLLELRDEDGRLRGIRIDRLKDKLGTRALPTAELTLEGTPATLLGGEGDGVKKIAAMLNITRLYNACCAVAAMRRGLALARDYAGRRRAFGKLLRDQPLHVETLAGLQVELEAGFHLTFRAVELLGREETGEASDDERALLRILTPLAKLYTGKQAIAVTSEVLECFGGAGYLEDTGLPRLLRDAQVLSIWEGTTNVLALDALRAAEKEDSLEALAREIEGWLGEGRDPFPAEAAAVERALAAARRTLAAAEPEKARALARQVAFTLAEAAAGALLLSQAVWSLARSEDGRAAAALRCWCRRKLTAPPATEGEDRAPSRALGLDEALPLPTPSPTLR